MELPIPKLGATIRVDKITINSILNKISGASHAIDANIYISKILKDWRK